MRPRLEDIIDLEFLIQAEADLNSRREIQALSERDREIFSRIRHSCGSDRDLLMGWLADRKKDSKNGSLPGPAFVRAVFWMRLLLLFSGFLVGAGGTYSFLLYHGVHPVNVALFFILFVGLQIIPAAIRFFLFFKKKPVSILPPAVFNSLIRLMESPRLGIIFENRQAPAFVRGLVRKDPETYRQLSSAVLSTFFAAAALGISTGAISGVLLKVLISDLAFGWQTTLMTGPEKVHALVSMIAIPWSWLSDGSFAVPFMEQIQGSRIILKDGIQVLSTEHLVSWWPFLTMSMICYTFLPRCVLFGMSLFGQKKAVQAVSFSASRFSQVVLRMKSPDLKIHAEPSAELSVAPTAEPAGVRGKDSHFQKTAGKPLPVPEMEKDAENGLPDTPGKPSGASAAVLLNPNVYPEPLADQVCMEIRTMLFLEPETVLPVCFDFSKDETLLGSLDPGIRQVVLIHEVWQPPIKEILFYLRQTCDLLPAGCGFCLLLTGDAASGDLSVDEADVNFQVWEKAVMKLNDPMVDIKRILAHDS